MEKQLMKIGDLAKLVHVTVRTLHHYHQIGLLIPGHMTRSGHRLYDEDDIQKLYHIITLKDFGFSLEEIRDVLHSVHVDPTLLIDLQLQKATELLERQQALCQRLKTVQDVLALEKNASLDDLIEIIVMMQYQTKKYLTGDKIEELKSYYASMPLDQVKRMKQEWNQFIKELARCYKENRPLDSADVRALTDYWRQFLQLSANSDEEVIAAGHRFHAENKDIPLHYGLTPELFGYLDQALKASGEAAGESAHFYK
ncbi:MerR family transcriptional regulator [Paenibacillus sp. GCM10027626]|uniref:MerR family transcriptional regulator n=1 Tax=Paenibacillus sp. GCM10027626 TaxID=3273411 RepID=UPI0036453CF3